MSDASIRVVRPGLLTTVQDTGRWGHQAEGVPVAGPMDWFSHRLANELVGNPADAATLEVTLIGPELIVEADTVGAIAGAEFEVSCDEASVPSTATFTIRRGARLRFGRRRAGTRAYLAIAGGILTPPVLGSRSTHLLSRMGGLDGRALMAGDELPLASPSMTQPVGGLVRRPVHRLVRRSAEREGGSAQREGRRAIGLSMPLKGRAYVRVMPGAQADWFAPEAWATLTSVAFRVSPRSNRMGYRLEGPPLARARTNELVTEPLAEGAIQVPAAGEPILLMADRQTAGGYPKIAGVILADLPLVGQLGPGDSVEFQACTRAEAVRALIARERQLLRYAELRGAS
jgi:antagonist of KipI